MAKADSSTPSPEVSRRPLDGLAIGISVSNSDDLANFGYTGDDVNRVTVRLCEALLEAGARLVFGHDWRPDGVMDAICRSAVKHQPPMQKGQSKPLLLSLLPWPDQPRLDPDVRRDLEQRGVMRIESVGLPEGEMPTTDKDELRAVALSHLRRKLAEQTDARVCLGGKEKGVQGFYAGVVEEAYNAAREGKPVYVGTFLGGAAAKVASYLRPAAGARATRSIDVFAPKSRGDKKDVPKTRAIIYDADEENLSAGFDSVELQKNSGLSTEDWQRLLEAPDVETFSALVIRGLKQRRLAAKAPTKSARRRSR